MTTAFITRKGRILQNKQIDGATITITRVVSSTAVVPVEELKELTAITNIKQTLSVQSITQNELEQSYTILVLLENTALTQSYKLSQIGFYANDPDDGEILFAVAQFDTPKPIDTPSVAPSYTLEMYFKFKNSSDANIEINFNSENLMTRAGVEAIVREVECGRNTTGNLITLTDAIDAPLLSTNVYGKSKQVNTNGYQLFNHGASEFATISTGGVNIINHGNGSFTVLGSGKMTGTLSKYHYYTHDESVALFKAGKLKLKCSAVTNPKVYIHPQINSKSLATLTPDNTTEFELTQDMLDDETFRIVLGLYANINEVIIPGTFSVMLYQDGDGTCEVFTNGKPTPSTNYLQEIVSVENPTINVYGKNMCPMSGFDTMTSNGADNTYNPATHTITLNEDTPNNNFSGRYCRPIGRKFKVGTTYTISFDIRGTRGRTVSCGFDWNRTEITLTDTFTRYKSVKVAAIEDEVISFYSIATEKGGLAAGEFMQFANVQICIGDDSRFEEYKDVQTATVDTPNGLHGIPVSEGGNYTDESGQQWICDEIDLAKKKYIQRVASYENDGTSAWGIQSQNEETVIFMTQTPCRPINRVKQFYNMQDYNWTISLNSEQNTGAIGVTGILYCICSTSDFADIEAFTTYLAGAPLKCLYPLAEPIETDLTDEQVAALESLSTHEGITNIFTDDVLTSLDIQYCTNTNSGKTMAILKKENVELKAMLGDVNKVLEQLIGGA